MNNQPTFRLTSVYFVIVIAQMTIVGKALEIGHMKNFLTFLRNNCNENYPSNFLYYNNYENSATNVST